MYKKIIIYLIMLFLVITTTNLQVKAVDNTKKQKVLIVYDSLKFFSHDDNVVYSIKELLGAFNTEVKTVEITDYKKNEINSYDYVFVIGIEGKLNRKTFINDLKSYNEKICWIGKGIDDLVENNKKYSMKGIDYNLDITEIYYSNKENTTISNMKKFHLDSKESFTILKSYSKKSKIYGYLSNGKDYFPYIINENNLWHVSRVDNNAVLFYIFSDVLNNIFEVKKFQEGKVFIKIEEVHPLTDINKLKATADYLGNEGIPFAISLTPTFVDSKTGYINTISDKKEFISAIKYIQKKGGAVILNGYINQNGKEQALGKGYEFWNGEKDEPLNLDMREYVYKKVKKALIECVENGIYPLAFEAPNYAMDSRGYREIKKYFSTYVGRYQSSDKRFTTTAYPYILKDTEAFNIFIPENLSYVEKENPLWFHKIQENFRKISMVRGHVGGVSFHSYVDINYLKKIVSYLEEQNVNFLDLKQEENWVELDDIKISSKNGNVNVQYRKSETDSKTNKENLKGGKFIEKVNSIITVIVAIFVTIFIIIFFISKKKDKNKFLR
ncbi:DUF2334 domain-containing protein [Clostridium botulinum]|nr:DUF2334 domain-containing protein [Clostridium botulinum]